MAKQALLSAADREAIAFTATKVVPALAPGEQVDVRVRNFLVRFKASDFVLTNEPKDKGEKWAKGTKLVGQASGKTRRKRLARLARNQQ